MWKKYVFDLKYFEWQKTWSKLSWLLCLRVQPGEASGCLVSQNPLSRHSLLDLSTASSVRVPHWAETGWLKCEGGFSFLISKPQGVWVSLPPVSFWWCFLPTEVRFYRWQTESVGLALRISLERLCLREELLHQIILSYRPVPVPKALHYTVLTVQLFIFLFYTFKRD